MVRSDPQVGALLHWRDAGLPSDQRPWALAVPSLLLDADSKVSRNLPVPPSMCTISCGL